MALTKAKLIELINNGDIDVGGGLMSYPVGAIYMSVVSTSPATLFGGTWSAIAAGKFLVAAGTGYAAGSTGGAAIHNHLLSGYGIAAIGFNSSGKNLHFNEEQVSGASFSLNKYWNIAGAVPSTYETSGQTTGISLAGGTSSVSGLPPYLAIYMWERTA